MIHIEQGLHLTAEEGETRGCGLIEILIRVGPRWYLGLTPLPCLKKNCPVLPEEIYENYHLLSYLYSTLLSLGQWCNEIKHFPAFGWRLERFRHQSFMPDFKSQNDFYKASNVFKKLSCFYWLSLSACKELKCGLLWCDVWLKKKSLSKGTMGEIIIWLPPWDFVSLPTYKAMKGL